MTFEILSRQVNIEHNNKESSDYFEKLPVYIFESLLNSAGCIRASKINQANFLQLQAYILQFLVEYFRSYGKKKLEENKINLLKDSGLIYLLLKKELFVVEFGDNSLLKLADKAKTN